MVTVDEDGNIKHRESPLRSDKATHVALTRGTTDRTKRASVTTEAQRAAMINPEM